MPCSPKMILGANLLEGILASDGHEVGFGLARIAVIQEHRSEESCSCVSRAKKRGLWLRTISMRSLARVNRMQSEAVQLRAALKEKTNINDAVCCASSHV